MRLRASRFGAIGSFALALALIAARSITAAELPKAATITQLTNDARLRPNSAPTRPAVVGDTVFDGTVIETGADSGVELTLADQTLARLSGHTVFSFDKGTRKLDLVEGGTLLRVPKRAGAKITLGTVSAGIAGTTLIVEHYPHAYLKFISLEGTVRVYLKSRWGESVLVRPGQMLITNPDAKGRLPDPVDVDLERLLKTSHLIADFPPLPNRDLIAKQCEKQQRAKSKKALVDTNLVIFGKGTRVSLTNPLQMTEAARVIGAPPSRPEAIPSSTDIGTIETAPSPAGIPAENEGAENTR